MRSSTSSFRTEVRVVLAVAAVLAVAEVGLRAALPRLSPELRRVRRIPEQADAMSRAKGARVLVLGSSLAECGYREDVVNSTLAATAAAEAHVCVIAFSDEFSREWDRTFQRYFAERGQSPDVLVIADAARHLHDGLPIETRRMVHHCDAGSALGVAGRYYDSFADQAEFLHAFLFNSYAHRASVRDKAFFQLIPNYERGHRFVQGSLARPQTVGAKPAPTYERFEALLAAARGQGARIVFAAMPTADRDEFPDDLMRVLRRHDVTILDVRDVPGLSGEHFVDETHLTPAGAELFSREYARRFAALLPRLIVSSSPQSQP